MIRRIATVVTAMAAVALVGCGNDSPTGPDTAPPLAPELLSGYSKAEGKVSLVWTPNAESDLAYYNIYEVGVDEPIGFAPAGTRAIVFESPTESPTPYRITAVDQSGNESAPSKTISIEYSTPPTAEPDNLIDIRG